MKAPRKDKFVVAAIRKDIGEVSATFTFATGHLVVKGNGRVVQELRAPDSWVALASTIERCEWGTRPTVADLLAYLERYTMTEPNRRLAPSATLQRISRILLDFVASRQHHR